MAKPKKKFGELTPAYRKRLEAAYKSGKFGQGYTSAGRAYAAGASRQVARGQASSKPGKVSEAERNRRRRNASKAQEWSRKHSQSRATTYDPPDGTPDDRAAYTERYLAAMNELAKGWKSVNRRTPIDWAKVAEFFAEYEVGDFDEYFGLVK